MSAGASLSSSASPPALVGVGGSRWAGGYRRGPRGPGRGRGTAAAVALGVCMNLGARLGRRGGRGAGRLGYYVMQQWIAPVLGMWEKKDPFPVFLFFNRVVLATVFLGCLPLPAHTFSLVAVEKGAGCGAFLPAPPRRGAIRAWELLVQAPCLRVAEAGSKIKERDFRGGFPSALRDSGHPPAPTPVTGPCPGCGQKP